MASTESLIGDGNRIRTKISRIDKVKRRADNVLDCACSALALNCCQFGCFIHNVPRSGFLIDFNPGADWMGHILKINPNVRLRSLCIPGSHNSASDTISPFKAFSAVGRTQNVSVLEQLMRGIRYLDIRIAGNATGVGIFHGCLLGAPFLDVLQEIVHFLNHHPSEFIFCEMVPEFGRNFSPVQKKEALDMIQEYLGPFLYKCETNCGNLNNLLNGCTLQELVQANSRVCLLIHPRIYKDFELNEIHYNRDYLSQTYHCFDSSTAAHNQWHNTRDINLLLQWNLEETRLRARDLSTVLINQFVLTPGVGGPADIPMLLLGYLSLRPVSFAAKLIPQMEEFFRSHADEPWNVVVMDFIDLIPGLLSFLISLNFVAELHILRASLCSSFSATANDASDNNSVDVTSVITKYVYRRKVLFLTNVGAEIGRAAGKLYGTLRVDFKLVDPNHPNTDQIPLTIEYDIDDDTQVVLSEYTFRSM